MNARIIFSMIAAAGMLLATTGMSAQEVATKKDYRKIEKHEKFLNKQVKDRAIRDARKEARKLEKQGYKAPVGKLPIDKQLEKAWQCQYEMDSNGYPFYFIATARTTGSNYSAAQMQAVNLAKLDLAGQIQTRVNQLVEAKVANDEISAEEAVSINSFVSASKNVISNSLGRVLILVEIYRVNENGNNEVQVTLGYNSKLATQEAIKAVQKSMGEEAGELMDELDSLLGIE